MPLLITAKIHSIVACGGVGRVGVGVTERD